MNTHPINKLYAWLSKDKFGNEGIVAMRDSNGNSFPLVVSDEKLLKDPSILNEIGKIKNLKIVWAEFERKHIL